MNLRFSLLPFALVTLAVAAPSLQSREKNLSQAKAEFAEKDQALNLAYQKTKSTLPEYLFAKIQEEQRDWIDYRDRRAGAAARLEGGAGNGTEKENPEYWNALTYLTETRIEILDAWTRVEDFPKTWEGVWMDGFGGILMIDEKEDGKFSFTCNVVRGASYHLGNIDGSAVANESTARFSTRPEGEENETWLTFVKENDGRLRIIGENTHYFHGARAYFDGKYLRIRELTKKDREEMAKPGF